MGKIAEIHQILKPLEIVLIKNSLQQELRLAIRHVPWAIGFESGLKKSDLPRDIRPRSCPNISEGHPQPQTIGFHDLVGVGIPDQNSKSYY